MDNGRVSGVVLLTGSAGFVGTYVARWLLRSTDCRIIAIVRADDEASARRRLLRAWWDWPELRESVGSRVEVLAGDVTRLALGLSDEAYADLARRVTHIIHAAADLRLNAPLEDLRRTNVGGTKNVLDLARLARRDGSLERFSYVSTAYVAGRARGNVREDSLTDRHGFASNYERSKYEAELTVREASAEVPTSVFRPGMVVGDTETGAIRTFNTVYFPLRMYLNGGLRVVPADPGLRVNMVPVDYVAESIGRLTMDGRAEGLTFHLTAPARCLPRADELTEAVREWARDKLGLALPKPLFAPALSGAMKATESIGRKMGAKGAADLSALVSVMPYFGETREFLRENSDSLLGAYETDWRRLLPKLLDYAVYTGFLHRSERTVHEQVVFRLGSRRRPITYHDVSQGQVVTRSASEVRGDILAAAAALRKLGVEPGDRVALVGLNSTRYLTLDVAIGLVGATTVPMYYTSPPADLDEMVADSGAKLLFVGAPKILERLSELRTEAQVVSFCRGPLPKDLSRDVTAWDEFLATGSGASEVQPAPVGLDAVATLRYTSGTTGRPKGAAFRHDSLRYMAESLASLLPWTARNSPATYLSFLPMNHVVEGILATYSPYYLPAPVDVYYLEEFRELSRTLPIVRPTVFFSVPRFYSKVWSALAEQRLGRILLSAAGGPLGVLAKPVLKRILLQKAGLDRCVQLIAGSAPSDDDLLRSYRELGIEIHNAYGLTEAPLVTLNRLGANRLGTVGEPLPQTEIRIADDCEVLVRGPQVMAGYTGEGAEQPFEDGWLQTGDLGEVSAEGSLVLRGRKKEVIVTSYGKNIFPVKIEGMLREIPGVAEAMIIGERCPFCTAVLWLNERGPLPLKDGRLLEGIDRAVRLMNSHLSHPEQIKRWAILPNCLSTEGGDLTANLKLRRQTAMQRFHEVIRSLYEERAQPADVLHLGFAEPGFAQTEKAV